MPVLVFSPQGRFGNATVQYLFARGYAERHGMTLRMDAWIGERIFQISHPRPDIGANEVDCFKSANELGMLDYAQLERRPNIIFRGYAQMTECAKYYTKRDAQRWLQLKPEIESICRTIVPGDDKIVCHLRRGDYTGYGYAVCAPESYLAAMDEFGLDALEAIFLSEESQGRYSEFGNELQFVVDFYRMMKAPTLLRANSSFSWLAGLLGNGLVLSPVIDGLEGGKEHLVKFVAGNHPKFASHLDFVTDLYVAP